MNEVEKLYSLAGVEKDWKSLPYGDIKEYYPPFTAEKQLELVKWLMNYPMLDEIRLYFNEPSKTYNIIVMSLPEECGYQSSYTETHNTFEQTIANLICNLWQDLTDAEKAQVKGILE